MRFWTPLLALAAAPALAQDGTSEVQPLEPLIVPGITQNNDGGGIVVRPVEPLVIPGAPEQQEDLLGEGFNDDAFDGTEGGFIDRAFGTGEESGAEDGLALDPGGVAPGQDTGTATGWFGSEGRPGEWRGGEEAAGGDQPRFLSAPFTTRGLYGPNRPSAIPRTPTVPADGAEIRQLDKMTGATSTIAMETGEEREIGRLRVRLEGCHAPEDGGTHGTVAFLRIWDPQQETGEPVFSGWMFADSPALSALDHPRYDLWVLGCTPTQAAEAAPAESEAGEG